MMEVNIKGFIVPKTSEKYSDCRDNYAVETANNKFAIADGVSKSFFPGIWSELLVNSFVDTKEEVDVEQLVKDCQKDWFEEVKKIALQPNQKYYVTNKFIQKAPGLSTFVGLEFIERDKKWMWKATAKGDSFLFFLPEKYKNFDDELITLSSKDDFLFDNFPDYYCSIGDKHKGELKIIEKELNEGSFYLMTDALAEWFLNEKEEAIKYINQWNTQDDFKIDIEKLRKSERLGNDDTAILTIHITKELSEKAKEFFRINANKRLNYKKPKIKYLGELIDNEIQQEINSTVKGIKEEQEELLKAEVHLQKEFKRLNQRKEELKSLEKKIKEEEARINAEKIRINEEGKKYGLAELEIVHSSNEQSNKKQNKNQEQSSNQPKEVSKENSSKQITDLEKQKMIETQKVAISIKKAENPNKNTSHNRKVYAKTKKNANSKKNNSEDQKNDVLNKF